MLRNPGLTVVLVFTKLASQLTTDKLADLAIIPLIFIVQTLISYLCSIVVSKAFGFSKRPRNFVIAMGASHPLFVYADVAKLVLGLWQFQFAANFLGPIALTDYQRATLENGARGQR